MVGRRRSRYLYRQQPRHPLYPLARPRPQPNRLCRQSPLPLRRQMRRSRPRPRLVCRYPSRLYQLPRSRLRLLQCALAIRPSRARRLRPLVRYHRLRRLRRQVRFKGRVLYLQYPSVYRGRRHQPGGDVGARREGYHFGCGCFPLIPARSRRLSKFSIFSLPVASCSLMSVRSA